MRGLALVATIFMGELASVADAAPLQPNSIAPVRLALAAIDRNDRDAFRATFATDATILDEISPFRFAGPGAAERWFDRLAAVNRTNAITGERTSIVGAPRGSVEGDDAYAVVDVRVDYLERGRAIVENGAWTFALKNAGGRWKIVMAAFTPQPPRPQQTR